MDGQDEAIKKQEVEQEQEQTQEQQQEVGSANQSMIKGKRTKRQRPQSPIPFRMITPPYPHTHDNSHNSSPTKSDHGSGIFSSSNNNNNNDNNHIEENSSNFMEANNAVDHHLTLSIATTITTTTTFTDEEEDIANCLILLAQGQARVPINIPPQLQKPNVLQDHRQDGNNNNLGAKFTSRKFMELTTAGKSGGYYVYECKTCSKTFSSFQALGGHRASHKKPRMAQQPNTIRNNNNSSIFTDDDDPPFTASSSSTFSLHLGNRASMMYGNNQSRPRVHECAICGAEFSSGQALGGHMRRHRGMVVTPAPPPLAAVAAEKAEPMATELMKLPTTNNNTTLSLDLDLNLPAPADDAVVDQNHQQPPVTLMSPANQQQNQQPQQQPLVLSSLALIDCHY